MIIGIRHIPNGSYDNWNKYPAELNILLCWAYRFSQYKLKGRDLSCNLFDSLYSLLTKKTKDLFGEFEKKSFTINIWSDLHSGNSLLSLITRGISKDFRRMSIILKCRVMYEHRKDDVILTKFKTILQEWDLYHQHCSAWSVIVDLTCLLQCSCQTSLRWIVNISDSSNFAFELVLSCSYKTYC